jgi:uncharacterized protein YneF (UPF0154 family)
MTDIIAIIINGAFNGFGTAIGSYLAVRYAIDHIDKIPAVKDRFLKFKE